MEKIIFAIILLTSSLVGGEFVTFNEALQIASNYKKEVQNTFFPKWRDANILDVEKFYDINGNIVGYEVLLSKKRGSFFISNDINEPLIPFVSYNGFSMKKTLQEYEKRLKKQFQKDNLTISDKRFFISLPICYGIGFKFDKNDSSVLKSANFQNGWFIFSPIKECRKVKYFKKIRRINFKIYKENKKFKNYLLNYKKSSLFFKNVKVKSITVNKKSRYSQNIGGANFSNFYQEYGEWGNGSCYIGCSPVAWGILLEYWDRHGFGNLVGSVYDNSNTETTDPDVRYMLRELRIYLETFCSEDGQGTTLTRNLDRGIYYVYDRGYGDSFAYIATKDDPFNAWMILMNNISENRPVIASITLPDSGSGHSTVAYKYIDSSYDINDRFCVKTGWKNLTDTCYSANYLNSVTVVVIKESLQIPPVADAGEDKTVVIGNSVFLDGSKSIDEDGYIKEYVWSVNGHILGYGEKITVHPPNVGKFVIKLTVTDNDGLVGEDSMILTVINSYSPSPKPYPTPSNSKMIVSALNGYCIDVAKADTSMGAKLITWPCHGGNNQKWYYEDGQIKSVLNGYCIDIAGANSSPGAELIMWRCHGGSNQRWYYENGEIKSALNGYCIDIANANSYKGAKLIVWPCHGGANQKWNLR